MYILFHYCQGFRIDELLPPTSLLLIQVWVHRVLLNSLENPPQGLPAASDCWTELSLPSTARYSNFCLSGDV